MSTVLRTVIAFRIITPTISVGCWLINVVDDEDINWAFGRFEFQAELLLDRAKERRCITIRRAWRQ